MQNSSALQLNPKHGFIAIVVVVDSSVDLLSTDVVWTSGGTVSAEVVTDKEVVLIADDAVVLDIDDDGLVDQLTIVPEGSVVDSTGDSVSTDVVWTSNEDDLVEKEVVFDIDDAVVVFVNVELFTVDELVFEFTVEKAALVVDVLAIDEKEKIFVEIFVLMDWSVVTGSDEADVEGDDFWLTVVKTGVVGESLFEDICS